MSDRQRLEDPRSMGKAGAVLLCREKNDSFDSISAPVPG